MKLIFLDIDGVLNSSSGVGPYESDMEVEKLLLLKRLIDESKSEGVIITSDRRYSSMGMSHIIDAFDKYEIYVVGLLRDPNIDDDSDNRGKQIMDYLDNSKDDIEQIVILDDNDDGISELFHEDFVQTNKFYGLDGETYQKALDVLNG